MRYLVRHVSWSPQRDAVVETMRQEIPELEVYVDTKRDWYAAFFAVCDLVDNTGAVLLENDVRLCRRFRERVEWVIQLKGAGEVISFFEKPKVPLQTAYVGGSNFSWMQCLYLPPGVPGRTRQYFDEFRATRPKEFRGVSVDIFLRYVFVKEKIKYWRVRPCLVQHLDIPSLSGHAARRVTNFFIDDMEDGDVLFTQQFGGSGA